MNRIYSYLICAISVISMAACTEELETFSVSLSSADENVEISEDGRNADVTILPEGSTAVVKVTSDTEWQLIDDSTDPYFEVQIDGNDVIISAEEMISSHEHSAKLRIQAGTNAWAYINVTQKGTELSQISLETKKIYFEEWGGVQEIRVMTNKDWYVENKDAVDGITIEEDGDVIRVAAEASLRPILLLHLLELLPVPRPIIIRWNLRWFRINGTSLISVFLLVRQLSLQQADARLSRSFPIVSGLQFLPTRG